jgi:hypothetical protein
MAGQGFHTSPGFHVPLFDGVVLRSGKDFFTIPGETMGSGDLFFIFVGWQINCPHGFMVPFTSNFSNGRFEKHIAYRLPSTKFFLEVKKREEIIHLAPLPFAFPIPGVQWIW